MPNYAQNTITINGSTKQVKAVLEFLRCKKETNEDKVYIDFNNIVEMPSCLNISTNGYCNMAYIALYGEPLSWLDPMIMDAKEKFDCWETEMQHIYKEMAKRCRENYVKTGHTKVFKKNSSFSDEFFYNRKQ
ncbi:hypothetical protein [Draconibacterium mangrovi]|uniref:hypothetical protein n=1 Tax=Draconibacterium mangrovi TaxID=2697469 RepID=UPI0013D1FAC2|nr:hypothetical protein [Draconibacterium mangrovi]